MCKIAVVSKSELDKKHIFSDIEMVVFDKDGTLIDIHHYWSSMIKFRADFIIESLHTKIKEDHKLNFYKTLIDVMGVDLNNLFKIKSTGPVGIMPREYIVGVVLKVIKSYDSKYTKEMVEDIFFKVDQFSKTKIKDIVKLLPGVEKILKSLSSVGVRASIATTDLTDRAKVALETVNIAKYFDYIVGADLVRKAKPSPDLIEYISEHSNISVGNMLLIGDSVADLIMARNADCHFIGVKTGLYSQDFVDQSKIIVNDLMSVGVEK